MEGIIFLWIMWGTWTYITFIMKKGKVRFISALLILSVIMTSHLSIPILTVNINVSVAVWFFMGAMLFQVKKKRQVPYYVLSTFVISISYVLYHIYLIYDPAIRLIINPWLLILIIIVLNRLLVEPIHLRLATLIIGLIHGEVLRVLVFINYLHVIGSAQFLDHMSLACLIVVAWYNIETIIAYFETIVKQQNSKKLMR